jgi:hypothetical protein
VARETIKLALTKYLNYKKIYFRWIPHALSEDQKKSRVDLAKSMLLILRKDEPKGFQHILTGDKTWLPFFLSQESMNGINAVQKGKKNLNFNQSKKKL